jgi:serine/threonine protein kinase
VSAVAYLHCKRITHRDIKPDNILVCNSMDKLFICDFNCARKLADGATLTNQVGTMLFAPPEVLLGQGLLGEHTDIWSAGMCLYFALSGGSTPATGKIFSSVETFGEYLANVTSADRQEWITSIGLSRESPVAQVVWACLNPDPAQRPDATLLLAHPWVTPKEECLRLSSLTSICSPVSRDKKPRSQSDAVAHSQRVCALRLGLGIVDVIEIPADELSPTSGESTPTFDAVEGKGKLHSCPLLGQYAAPPGSPLPCAPSFDKTHSDAELSEWSRESTNASPLPELLVSSTSDEDEDA